MQKLKILFWKCIAIIWDMRPNNLPKRYTNYPIAWRWEDDGEEFEYPEHIKILYEWREKGKHWIIITR